MPACHRRRPERAGPGELADVDLAIIIEVERCRERAFCRQMLTMSAADAEGARIFSSIGAGRLMPV